MCVLKTYLHTSLHYLILFCMPCCLISCPPCIWFCYSHPGWHLLTSHFCFSFLSTTFMLFLCGLLRVSSKTFPAAERVTFRFCQKAVSSWQRSSRGNSQMMTAIVKGQISPCDSASDCMFISFWSGRDSKPLSRSPHSPNSWSSACHWNRLRADPGESGCLLPTSVLAERMSSAVLLSFILYSDRLTS